MRAQKLPLDKFAIAAALQERAGRLELKGGGYFKARAFKIGARGVAELTEDIGKLINENRLTLVKGIGQTLAKQIAELYATGESSFLSKLRAELPAGILELVNVPGLNVKKVERLQEALGVSSIDELKAACEAGKVRNVKGFGVKTEQKSLKANLKKLDQIAATQKLKLTESGIEKLPRSRAKNQTPARSIRVKSEWEIYDRLGMQYVPPELREDAGEVEAALNSSLPEDLITEDDIQGMVHCHTMYSDGKHSIEQMAHAAQSMGMKYLTITDHSPTAFYAGGVKIDQLQQQWEEIERVQEQAKIKILKGTESDILADGSLDYPDWILEQFDVIVASIHSRYKMDEDKMTRRLTAAMRQPVFKVWGHALGRLIQRRPPFDCRVEEILDVIAESRAAIEINGDPYRLDMEPLWLREARKRKIKFVISVDAHSTGALNNLKFGVGIARRGWVRRGEVLNTLPVKRFQKAVRPYQNRER